MNFSKFIKIYGNQETLKSPKCSLENSNFGSLWNRNLQIFTIFTSHSYFSTYNVWMLSEHHKYLQFSEIILLCKIIVGTSFITYSKTLKKEIGKEMGFLVLFHLRWPLFSSLAISKEFSLNWRRKLIILKLRVFLEFYMFFFLIWF